MTSKDTDKDVDNYDDNYEDDYRGAIVGTLAIFFSIYLIVAIVAIVILARNWSHLPMWKRILGIIFLFPIVPPIYVWSPIVTMVISSS